jgi:DNA polymerase epsilon subunit 1
VLIFNGYRITDVGVKGSFHADALLIHAYKWLCSPGSLMYDPSLHRTVCGLMKKLFTKMVRSTQITEIR